jgi:hypothetical protein
MGEQRPGIVVNGEDCIASQGPQRTAALEKKKVTPVLRFTRESQ